MFLPDVHDELVKKKNTVAQSLSRLKAWVRPLRRKVKGRKPLLPPTSWEILGHDSGKLQFAEILRKEPEGT
jgi:hypothetical protein